MAVPMIGPPGDHVAVYAAPAEDVAKTFGSSVPESFRQGEIASQMTPASPFSPGQPIGPYDGYDRTPRSRDFVTGYNIAARPRLHERVSFETLRGLVEAYDIAQIAVWHRIDSIRALDWKLIAKHDFSGDASEAISIGMKALKRPDRINSFSTWLAKYLYDILAYDAGCLYRLRNRAGKVVGLSVVDGTTIAPLLDYWGNPPQPPAEAFVQYVNGLPWNWLTRDDIIYEPFRPVPNSLYGRAPLESIILNANCYSDDTEVLTDRGWLRFAEVDISSDRFATRNPATAEFEWQSATRYYEADSDGTMYRAASRNVDLLVTGGHRLLVDRLPKGCPGVRHGSEWLVHAEDLCEYQSALPGRGAPVNCPATSAWSAPDLEFLTLPVSPGDFVCMDGESVREAKAAAAFPVSSLGIAHATVRRAERGERLRRASAETICDAYGLPRSVIREDPHYFSGRIEGDDFAAFMGMYLSEGCVRADGPNITIAQEEYSKGYVEYRDLLARMLGREAPYHRGAFTFGHTALADYLRPLGKAHEKYIPREVLGMSRRQLEIFWHFYVLGDGAIYPRTEIVSTCSRRLADGLQEVLQKIGLSGAVRPVGRPAKPAHHQRWQIQTRRTPAYRVNVERVPYEGKVYCVSVPSKTLYVRRNGYPVWCANTDIRFQVYFLQRFTDGNLPAAFASSPDAWSPDQIEQFQSYWDSFMYGDQSRKHQIRWMPGGSKLMWSNEKDFSDRFSMFMLRKTLAAYHTVPSDLGFTEDVNRSSGESQADVVHKVGELPLENHVEGIIDDFLQEDLGLPLEFQFDRGEEQDDRLQQAQADDIYIKNGTVSASYISEIRFGRSDPRPIPRFVFTERSGPIPLNSLEAVAGEIDPETAMPALDAPLPHQVFEEAPGVEPNPPLYGQPLAEQIYGPKAIPPHTEGQGLQQVKKDAAPAAPAAGITAETGIYSDPLIRDDDEDEPDEQAVAKELAAFRNFRKKRRQAGQWHDFRFEHADPVTAHRLNDSGRLAVRKAAGEVAVAGLAVRAADTGRVLMLQRALCDDDPAAGKLEFPGGHLDNGESPLAAAWREFAEETGCPPPAGEKTGEWTAGDGIYRGIVWTTETEAGVPVRGGSVIPNPDDPDGDQAEAILWMDPADLPGNPVVRDELAASLPDVMAALGQTPDDGMVSKASVNYRPSQDPARCCGTCSMIRPAVDGYVCTLVEGGIDPGAVCDEWDPAQGEVAKAADARGPKAGEVRKATHDLSDGGANLTGPWRDIYGRRAKLLAKHQQAVSAAWDACMAEVGSPRPVVREFRGQAGAVAKLADPRKPWWKDAGTAAALAWLERLRDTKGWPALVAALEDAIRSGMAEGEAGALALAADRQGTKGFDIGKAFRAAYQRLADDPGIAQQAQDAADGLIASAAKDAGRALADSAEDDGSEDDMTDAVDEATSGDQATETGTDWRVYGAILGGALTLYGRSGEAESEAAPGPGGVPPPGTPPPGPVLLNWITAGDSRVCPACSDYEDGSPYTPDRVPAYPHPRCRCSVDLASGSGFPSFLAALLS